MINPSLGSRHHGAAHLIAGQIRFGLAPEAKTTRQIVAISPTILPCILYKEIRDGQLVPCDLSS